MAYRSDNDYFPPTKPTGWNQRNMQMTNKRWQIQWNKRW